jgi:chromosomal replication initiation ATPase DnaA
MTTVTIKSGHRTEIHRLSAAHTVLLCDFIDSLTDADIMLNKKNITPALIESAVKTTTGLDIRANLNSRKREHVLARYLYIYLICKYRLMDYEALAVDIGGFDRTTMMHAERTMKNRIGTKDDLVIMPLQKIYELLNNAEKEKESPSNIGMCWLCGEFDCDCDKEK